MKSLYLVLFFCLYSANLSESKKLNYPRLLLPIFDDFSVNFTLEVIEKGCFNWKTSRPDLVRVTPLYDEEDCSYRAVVTPVTKEKVRNTPLVLAEEQITSYEVNILRCDVILDVINSFEVITTTRELYLQEAPEKFELLAHDSLGNAFSSLEGVEFQWEIFQNERSTRADGHWTEVLRFMKFSESTYHEVPQSMEVLERKDLTGYMILLEGINTGTAKVSVKLPYNEYRNVRPVEVDIMVLANILIDPSDVYILVGDSTQYRIFQLTQGKVTDISANSQYYLEVENEAIAKLKNNVANGLKLGRTLVLLRDKNVASDQEHNALNPKATLNVVEPAKLVVDLLPHYNWITLEGEHHEIVFTLLTADDQRIVLGDSFKIQSQIDNKYFRVDSVLRNGTHNAGQALKMGTSLVFGKFEGLSTKAELMIYKRINLKPKLVILPFDPVQNFKPHRIQFLADGGDGNYLWTSDNKNLVTITKTGLVESRLTELTDTNSRKAQIKVALQRNPKLFETAEILFLEPVKLEIILYNFETALDDVVKVHLALFAQSHQGQIVPFTDCSNLKFETEFSEHLFTPVASNDSLAESACQLLVLKALSVGRTQLKVSYRYIDKVLSDTVQLVVFERVNLMHPEHGELVLPIGSSQNVIFKNGPQRLFNVDAELNKELSFSKQIINVNEVSVQSPNSQNINVLNVLCVKLGETDLKLTMTNVLNTNKQYNPYLFDYTLRVFCVKPRFLNLISKEKVHDSCPMNSKVNSIVEINGDGTENEFIEIEVEVSDVSNRKLANISSLELNWKLLQDQEEIDNFNYVETSDIGLIENIPISKAFLLKLDRNLKTDLKKNFKLIGSVVGYNEIVMNKVGVLAETPAFGIRKTSSSPLMTPLIESEINFMAINATLLPVDRISIFYKSSGIIPILQGSGYYELVIDDVTKIKAQLNKDRSEILITPLELGDTILSLIDRCLTSLKHEVLVSVVSINKIDLRVSDKVEKGKSIEAIARLRASNNDYLNVDYNNLDVYELSVDIINRNVLKMHLSNEQRNLEQGEVRFKVTGMEQGETKVSVNSGKFISSSPPNSIQVFPPLELFPKNSTILIGTTIQIQTKGGPLNDVGVEFEALDERIVQMDSSVVLGLKLGKTKIIGKCIGFDPTTGSMVTFSEDFVYVNVVPLDAVKIVAPLTRMRKGAVMPAALWALPNIPPSVLGTLQNFKIFWTTDQPDVLEISNIFSAIGVDYAETDLISVRIRGTKTGKATLFAKAVTPNGRILQSSVDVFVLNELELEKPKPMSSSSTLITMPPNSEIQLKTNIEDTVYKLQSSAAGGGGPSLINVTETGLVKSGDEIGFAFIMASSSLDQQLPVLVRVKNIHYILTSLVTESDQLNLRMMESKIPRGITLKLKITFHDNVGNEILHSWDGAEHLKFALSRRRDALNVHVSGDFQLAMALSEETSNILTVGVRGLKSSIKYAEDFVKISVYASTNVFPATEEIFTVGDVVCFESIIPPPSRWTSSDLSSVKINERSGLALIVDSSAVDGKVAIFHENSLNGLSMRFEADVRPVDMVDFVRPSDVFNGHGEYRAYFVLKNRLQGPKDSNVVARNVSRCISHLNVLDLKFFTCDIMKNQNLDTALTQKMKLKGGLDTKTGQYYCSMSLVDFEKDWRVYLGRNNFLVSLEVRLKSGVMATSDVKIITGVIVEPAKVTLIDEDDTKEIVVYGRESYLTGLQVVPSQKGLDVRKMSMSAIESEGEHQFAIKYQVKVVGQIDESSILTVSVQSPQTEQNLTIPVDLNNDRKCSAGPASSFWASVVSNLGLIISTAVVFIVVTYVGLSFTSKTYTNPQVFQTSSPKLNGSNPNLTQTSLNTSSPVTQLNLSSSFNTSPSAQYPVYGDSGQISPHRRVNRRFL